MRYQADRGFLVAFGFLTQTIAEKKVTALCNWRIVSPPIHYHCGNWLPCPALGSLRLALLCIATSTICGAKPVHAAGGSLTVTAHEKGTDVPLITRMEVLRGDLTGSRAVIRRCANAGVGVVLDRQAEISMPDGAYAFRMIRGPEYRVVTGGFSLERTSLDTHSVALPRMIDMLEKGWTSGDCLVPGAPTSIPLRMASEDLHLATVLNPVPAKPIAGRKASEKIEHDPSWVVENVSHYDGLTFYGDLPTPEAEAPLAVEFLASLARSRRAADGNGTTRVAIENPFAWQLPVWLASDQLDGCFVLGDWLRLDRKVLTVKNGRPPEGPTFGDGKTLGFWAEKIYWNLLDCGFAMPALAGTGSEAFNTPIGYNRLYVAVPADRYHLQANERGTAQRVTTQEGWWNAAWNGHSVATNGPLLRPTLGGLIPGHTFRANTGEVLELHVELALTTRDPVEYLEVMHNNRVHYSARLDEFAKAGGKIPPLHAKESGWVAVRVVTQFKDHYRAAVSAPWYIEFDQQPRVSRSSVEFFQRWLVDYEQQLKKLPAAKVTRHVPYIRAARTFWSEKMLSVNSD